MPTPPPILDPVQLRLQGANPYGSGGGGGTPSVPPVPDTTVLRDGAGAAEATDWNGGPGAPGSLSGATGINVQALAGPVRFSRGGVRTFTILPTGEVSIGTVDPHTSDLFDVFGVGGATRFALAKAGPIALTLHQDRAGQTAALVSNFQVDPAAFVSFDLESATAYFSMRVTASGDATPNAWSLYDVTASAQRIIVDSSGRVGIGNIVPQQLLAVGETQNAGTYILVENGSPGANAVAGLMLQASLWEYLIQVSSAGAAGGKANSLIIYDAFANKTRFILGPSGAVAIGPAAPDPSAILDMQSTTAGVLPPRMTDAEMRAIPSPATSLLVFNTDAGYLWFWNGTAWQGLGRPVTLAQFACSGTSPTGSVQYVPRFVPNAPPPLASIVFPNTPLESAPFVLSRICYAYAGNGLNVGQTFELAVQVNGVNVPGAGATLAADTLTEGVFDFPPVLFEPATPGGQQTNIELVIIGADVLNQPLTSLRGAVSG